MPYPTLDSLPAGVKKHPKHDQEIWQATWNADYDEHKDEARAFAAAWAALNEARAKRGESTVGTAAKFEFDLPITHVWKDDSGRLFFEGVASTGEPDIQQERVSDNCMKMMAEQVGVDIYNVHDRIAGRELGVTLKHSVVDGDLFVTGELFEDNPEAVRVYRRMAGGKQYGLSIGGPVKGAYWEINKEVGRRIRVLDAIELTNMVITDHPADRGTWTSIIAKCANESEEFDMEQEPEAAKVDISNAAWDGKRSDLPKSAYLIQADNWSDCSLPVYEPDTSSPKDEEGHYTKRGALNKNGVRAALAAVGGARTGKPMDVPQGVKDKLESLAAQCGIDVAEAKKEDAMAAETAKDEYCEPTVEQEPIPVNIVEVNDEPVLPSTTLADNLPGATAEETFEEVTEALYPLIEALSATIKGICGAEVGQRVGLLTTALSDFQTVALAAVSGEIAKSGARHSAADVKTLHSAITSVMKACGCDTCAKCGGSYTDEAKKEALMAQDTDEKLAEGEEASTLAAEAVETAVDTAPVAPVDTPAAEDTAAAAAEPETPVETTTEAASDEAAKVAATALDDLVAKTVAVQIKPVRDELEAAKTALATANEQLAALKALPAGGGPVAKVSGDEEVADIANKEENLLDQAVEAGDRRTYFHGLAARMQGYKV